MTHATRNRLLKHFPAMGPCLICCVPTYRQNHRLIEVLRDRFHAGESIRFIAKDYRLPYTVVRDVVRVPIRRLDFLRRNFTTGAAELATALKRLAEELPDA